jgi:cobaltochelatase CobS
MKNILINTLKDFPTKELKTIVELATNKPLGFDMFRPEKAKDGIQAPQQAGKEYFINWAVETYQSELIKHFKLTPAKNNDPFVDDLEKDEKQTVLKETVKTTNGNTSPNPLDGLMQYIMEHAVKPEQVEKIVQDTLKKALEDAPVQTVVYNKVEKTKVKLDVTHSQFEEIFKAVTAPGVNVCLVGPSGSGKTSISKQIAKSLGYDFVVVSITAGISEGHLTGWLLPIGKEGKFLHVDAIALEKWQKGNCLILIDEMDSADPNTLLIANTMLSQDYMFLPQRHEQPEVVRGEGVIVMGAMNTYGTGADMIYSGRNQLDGATLARFTFIELNYCKKLEKQIIKNDELLQWAFPIRTAIKRNRIQRLMSTHTLLQYASLLEHAGWTMNKVEKNYFQSWSRDEKSKVLATAE